MTKRKRKGYVLAIVMLFAFVLAAATVTTFAIVLRYENQAKKKINELRQELQTSESSDTGYIVEFDESAGNTF